MSSTSGIDVAPFNGFSKKFYKALSKLDGNVISSPLSCLFALGMLYNGSKNETRTEMAKALQLPEDIDETSTKFSVIVGLLKYINGVELSVANKAFVAEGLNIIPEYINRLEYTFLASAENVNFANGEEATAKINEWVKTETKGKIEKLFDEDLGGDTSLVLLNALYFKGQWKSKFDVKDTTLAQFFSGGKKIFIETEMMHQKGEFLHAELKDQDAQVIVLPYDGDDVNMLIVLPNENTGLEKLIETIHDLELNNVMSLVQGREVDLFLPKFKIETTINMVPYLQEMGFGVIFGGADFSGISETTNLSVSQVLQKAIIEVNEEGTEASGVSGIVMEKAGNKKVTFRCDHPFLYFLTHRENFGLFGGKFEEPSEDVGASPRTPVFG